MFALTVGLTHSTPPLRAIAMPCIAQAELQALIGRLNEGLPYDESRLELLLQSLEANPEYKKQQADIQSQWLADNAAFMQECLQVRRSLC